MPDWITSPDVLAAHFQQPPARIGLDTEFVRERTYWPQLALVQIAVGEHILLVDPLAPGMAEALVPILSNPGILKIMHSASEDMVAFKHTCGVVPSPLFDTQMAAALAGIGAGMGYQKLVEHVTGEVLAKGETRSDWLRRPLSESQLKYAADDVVHLFQLHDMLRGQLESQGRLAWLEEDCARFVDNASQDEFEPWPHLSLRSAQFLEADAQVRLVRLLRWRDAQARSSDKPRSWILDNELAVTFARSAPESNTALDRIFNGNPKAPRRLAATILKTLHAPLDDEASIPLARVATDADKNRLKRLQEAVAQQSANLGLPDGVLASRRALEALMEAQQRQPGEWPGNLSGWRRVQLEPLLVPLLQAPG